jgi:hypothetical protein
MKAYENSMRPVAAEKPDQYSKALLSNSRKGLLLKRRMRGTP